MTHRINVSSLISYFKKANPEVAYKIASLAGDDTYLKTASTIVESKKELVKVFTKLAAHYDEQGEYEFADVADEFAEMSSKWNALDEEELQKEEACPGCGCSPCVCDVVEEEVDEEDLPLEDEEQEPSKEYDEVDLEEFNEKLNNLSFRLTDRPRKERWGKAYETMNKAMQYLMRFKQLRDKAHRMFDEAEEPIRFKYKLD